jgi:hypothetical protein
MGLKKRDLNTLKNLEDNNLNKAFLDLSKFKEPNIQKCIEFLNEKDMDSLSSEEALYNTAIINNLIELQLRKDIPELTDKYNRISYFSIVNMSLVVIISNIIDIFLIPNLFYIISIIGLDIFIIVNLIKLYFINKSINVISGVLEIIKNRKGA